MSLIKSHIQQMKPYQPPIEGRNPGSCTLLDFNERTIGVPKALRKAIANYLESDVLQVYPAYGDFVECLEKHAGVKSGQLMITNGSDHGIELIVRSICDQGDEVIVPSPGFAMYYQSAQVQGARLLEPAYTLEKGFPTKEILELVGDKTRLIFIANPNNPTGTAVSQEEIIHILEKAPLAAVIVDECYFEYTKETVKDSLSQYSNLFVTRTFSKTWGLAAVRLGYILSDSVNVEHLLKIRGPYDMNQFAEVAVRAALEDSTYVQSYVDEVLTESKPLLENFLKKSGIPFWPSAANFIFTYPEDPLGVERFLRESGILVRPKKDAEGKLGLRIGLGTRQQTEQLVSKLSEYASISSNHNSVGIGTS